MVRKSSWLLTFGICFLSSLLNGCLGESTKKHPGKIDILLTEKDLVPEGLAFDSVTQSIYISSTFKRKIVRIDSAGRVSDFIASAQDGIWSTIGMEVDSRRRYLWVISSQATDVLPMINPDTLQWQSGLFQYSLEDGKLIKSWRLSGHPVFLNDLTIDDDGDIYLTESVNSTIYRLDKRSDSLVKLLSLPAYPFINGLDFNEDGSHLYVASDSGIIQVNFPSLTYALMNTSTGIDARGIDGLSFYQHNLIAHQGNKILILSINHANTGLIESRILDTGPEFDGTTTGERSGKFYYYIVNSQISSAVDKERKMLKPADSIDQIIIRKIPL